MTKPFVLFILMLLVGCAGTGTQPPPPNPNPPSQPSPNPTPPTQPRPTLPDGSPVIPSNIYLLSGEYNPVFLGCLSCNEFDPNSVHNRNGLYGSDYSITSIFNNNSFYGSSYSLWSACNPNTLMPPIVIDGAGNYYGRLTVNANYVEAIRNQINWLETVVCT